MQSLEASAVGSSSNCPVDGVAIIGMSGRFPGATNLSEFWRNLSAGTESICRLSDEQLRTAGVSSADLQNPYYVKARGILEGADLFDAEFFGFTPREAELTDPQHRVLLECAWHALEDAGYDPVAYPGRTAVFAGASPNRYFFNNIAVIPDWNECFDSMKVVLGNDLASLATRIAYKLDLHGPAVNLQTACSTSLIAVHMGCQSLLAYESDMALAGGVSIIFPQEEGYQYQEGGILSPDGHCRTFDANARGTVSGSGVGVVVLKRLAEAIADGDNICAVIRGSAINNDGASKVGFTAPSIRGQADVISAAQSLAGVQPEMVTYVEAHGTATPLGDPVEVEALTRVFADSSRRREPCVLGSVKTNIGHLDAAAGIAALVKVVLALQHRKIPPSLHFHQANPQIDLERSPFRVSTQLQEWNPSSKPRIAGVSSFGIGGTNVHAIVQEAPERTLEPSTGDSELLVLSGKTDSAVLLAAERLAGHLDKAEPGDLPDIAYTLQVGRRAFPHRLSLVCRETHEASRQLRQMAHGSQSIMVAKGEPAVFFLFPGQGSQYANMTAKLYVSEPSFAYCIDQCAEIAARVCNFDFRQCLYVQLPNSASDGTGLDETLVTQLAVFAVDYSLAQLWMHLGVRPKAILGHSLGEYVAACVAGVFSLEQAISLVCARAELMQKLPRGAMTAVPLGEADLLSMIPPALDLAAVNGPEYCVVSGPIDAITEFETELSRENVVCRRLRTSHAFHSKMMDPAMEPLAAKIAKLELKAPRIAYISNLTGSPITAEEAVNPDYWSRHLRSTVRFGDGCAHLMKESPSIFLEVGPGATLTTLLRKAACHVGGHRLVTSLGNGADSARERESWLKALGTLWALGRKIDWPKLHSKQARRRVSLPGYPFQRNRYFLEQPQASNVPLPQNATLKRENGIERCFFVPAWKQSALIAADEAGQRGNWIVFCGAETFGFRFAAWLERRGHSVVRVLSSAQQEGQGIHSTKAMHGPDFDQLLHGFGVTDVIPRIVADFTSCPPVPSSAPELQASESSELGELLRLVQSLAVRQGAGTLHLGVFTRGLYRVTGFEDIRPEKALLLGPARVLAQEVPGVSCEVIDIEFPAPETLGERRLFARLETELLECRRDPFVAYRGDQRWECLFESLTLDEGRKPRRLREEGVYLITGGLGGLGLEIAGFLAQTVKARLVLINRTPFPSREQWGAYAENHAADGRTSRRISRLMAMEAMGARVLVLAADVSEEASLRSAVSTAVAHFGTIHGVVHAAGSAGGCILALQSSEKVGAILKAKAAGTVLLEQTLREQNLDFMVLFSSHASILGGVGRADYAAANAFLDAFAYSRDTASPGVVTAINWDTWSEVGMAADESFRQNRGPVQDAMPSAKGVEAFRRILSCDFPQVIVSLQDFPGRLQQALSQTATRSLENAEQERANAQKSLHERPELSSPYDVPATPEERAIADLWGDLLGIRGIGAEDNFFELGGDSVIGIQVVAQLRKAGLHVTPKQVFEQVTPRALAAVLNTRAIHAEQGLVMGPVPLTPVQRWFLERSLTRPNLFNQDVLVTLTRTVSEPLLEQAFQEIVKHHDALRLRIKASETGWLQWIADFEPIPLKSLDFSGVSTEARAAALEQAATEIQDSLSLSDGPIIRMALFKFGHDQPARLLIVIHHIAIDGTSWPALLEDLQMCYFRLALGQQPELPPKTTSFQYWSRKLEEYACLKSVERESRYWLSGQRRAVKALLPRDLSNGINSENTLQRVPVLFSKQQTEDLMQTGMKLGTQVHEILLASVSKAVHDWTGASQILVDIEGLGREPLFEDVDLSRTVGWFTAIYPLFLFWPVGGGLQDILDSVQNQIRSVPKGGMGYGLLRYMGANPRIASDLRALPQPEISFLYAGRSSQEFSGDSLFGFAPESSGISRASEQRLPYLIDIYARIVEGRLTVDWGYSAAIHYKRTIEGVVDSFASAICGFIQLGTQRQLAPATPSFNEFGWSNSELLKIHKAIEESSAASSPGASYDHRPLHRKGGKVQ